MIAHLIRPCAALVALGLLAAPAAVQAAEFAEYRVLGYSPDGRHFAFEQFGISDGIGLPYADIFVLDLDADSWVAGSPIRVRRTEKDGEAADLAAELAAVRDEAAAEAADLLEAHAITVPHRLLAATTPMEAGGQETELGFYPRPIRAPIDPLHTLTLETFPLESPNDCFGMVDTQGYRLSLAIEGGATSVVHEDESLPASRPCPEDYGLAAVVVPFDGNPGRAVALVSLYQLGFEGADRRFLAVPFDLSF